MITNHDGLPNYEEQHSYHVDVYVISDTLQWDLAVALRPVAFAWLADGSRWLCFVASLTPNSLFSSPFLFIFLCLLVAAPWQRAVAGSTSCSPSQARYPVSGVSVVGSG